MEVSMGKKIFSFVLLLLLCSANCYAGGCDGWLGTWDVEIEGGVTSVWVIDNFEIRDDEFLPCVALGTNTADGSDPVQFKIFWLDKFSPGFFYTEAEGEFSQSSPMSKLDLGPGSFTGDEEFNEYGITSGERRNPCMSVMPNSMTVDGHSNTTGWVELSFEQDSWPGDDTINSSDVEFTTSCTEYVDIDYVEIDTTTMTIMVQVTVAADAPDTNCALILIGSDGEELCLSGFEIISEKEETQEVRVPKNLVWGAQGSGEGEFQAAHGIDVDAEGKVYVVDQRNDRIQIFDSKGSFIDEFGTKGSGDGELAYPSNLAVDSAGDIYVVDQQNYRIVKFDPDGNFVTTWGPDGAVGGGFIKEPAGVAVDSSDNVYVADVWQSLIQMYDSDGTFMKAWAYPADISDEDSFRPTCVAVGPSGFIYMTDYLNDRVQKFDPVGTLTASWGSQGTGEGEFSYPTGITVDSAGNVYVMDTFNHRMQKFDSDGNFLSVLGTEGLGYKEFNWPFGVAVGPKGDIFITDTFNHRIQKIRAGICYAVSLLGENDPRLSTIRRFRDEVMNGSVAGRKLTELYYKNGEKISAALEKKPTLKKTAKIMLKSLVPLMEIFLKVRK